MKNYYICNQCNLLVCCTSPCMKLQGTFVKNGDYTIQSTKIKTSKEEANGKN